MFSIGQKCIFTYLVENASEYEDFDGLECVVRSGPLKDSDDRIYYKVDFLHDHDRWAYEKELTLISVEAGKPYPFKLIDGIRQIKYN